MRSFDDFIREFIPVCSKCGDYMMDADFGDYFDGDLVCNSCVRAEKLDYLLDE